MTATAELTTIEEKIPAVDAEIVEDGLDTSVLDEQAARRLDKNIRAASKRVADNVDELIGLIEQAVEGQIHVALGLPSLTAYFNDAVAIAPTDKGERQLMAAIMSGKGMSQRAIASALNVSVGTVNADLSSAEADRSDLNSDHEPSSMDECAPEGDITVGIDGRDYQRKPKAEAVESRGQAKALKAAVSGMNTVARVLEDAFGDAENFDADVTPDLIGEARKEIRAHSTRISKVLSQFKDLR